MNLLRKALQRCRTPSNTISCLCLETMRLWGVCFGTLRLRCKAALLGVSLGPGVRAHGPVGLLRWPGGSISIGARVIMTSSWRRASAASLRAPVRLRVFGPGASIEIGEETDLNGTSITARSQRIRIGRSVMLAPNCVIVDSDFHALWPPEARKTNPDYKRDAPVTIGDYAWIGMNCLILKGVSIGEGAMIGAGSVVTRDVPPFCLAAGAPARVLRRLGPEDEKKRAPGPQPAGSLT
ncbi:acyltransferase [Desulfovibrio sp. SGI.169]|uniref:acyltransferase n=1 Tax=Desulfovibrio sp. SGI.169 TaxID=3420561 RepID=UPI003CFD3B5E